MYQVITPYLIFPRFNSIKINQRSSSYFNSLNILFLKLETSFLNQMLLKLY